MPRCKACGTEAPALARFCSICGAQIAPTAPPPPAASAAPKPAAAPTPSPAAGPSRTNAALLGAGAVLLLGGAGFLFAKASGLLGAPSPSNKTAGVLSAPGTQPAEAPILSPPQTDTPRAPIAAPPEQAGAPMPEDVIAYLRWLKAYHKSLADLNSSLSGIGMSIVPELYLGAMSKISEDDAGSESDKPDFGGKTKATLNDFTQKLNLKTAEFQQRTPPNPCAALAVAYNQSLVTEVRQISSMVGVISKILDSLSGEVGEGHSERQAMLPDLIKEEASKGLSREADGQVRAADDALNALRDRYTQIPSDIDRSHFSLEPLSSGMDPSKLLSGKLPGM